MLRPTIAALTIALVGFAPRADAQCTKDTDCKGTRVCEAGKCVADPGSTPVTEKVKEPPKAAEPAPAVKLPRPPATAWEREIGQGPKGNLQLVPGIGVPEIPIGVARGDDVLNWFGARDSAPTRWERVSGAKPRPILYDPIAAIDYKSNERALGRPNRFEFDEETLLLTGINFCLEQRDVSLSNGIRPGMTPPEVVQIAGEPDEVKVMSPGMLDVWRYDAGFKLVVRTMRPVVTCITVVPAAKKGRK